MDRGYFPFSHWKAGRRKVGARNQGVAICHTAVVVEKEVSYSLTEDCLLSVTCWELCVYRITQAGVQVQGSKERQETLKQRRLWPGIGKREAENQ